MIDPVRQSSGKNAWREAVVCVGLGIAAGAAGCSRTVEVPPGRPDLETMETTRIHIGDHAFEVWLAGDDAQRQRGLMEATADQLAPTHDESGQGLPPAYRGMLFIFADEQPLAFWMLNTIIPLDIAYVRSDGVIVSTYTMAPLETRTYPSIEPAQFALEVQAGLFAELGIAPGDHVEIPQAVLKGAL